MLNVCWWRFYPVLACGAILKLDQKSKLNYYISNLFYGSENVSAQYITGFKRIIAMLRSMLLVITKINNITQNFKNKNCLTSSGAHRLIYLRIVF